MPHAMDAWTVFSRVRTAIFSVTRLGGLPAPQAFFWSLVFSLAAVVADQSAAPVLSSSSPVWALACCCLLMLRHGDVEMPFGIASSIPALHFTRVAVFFLIHLILILAARALTPWLHLSAGAISAAGWLIAALKLSVLAPTLAFFSFRDWRFLARIYSAEFAAAFLVLFTFSPRREMESVWPWYAQFLGQSVLHLARVFVSGIGYVPALPPTVTGPSLDVTILLSCSGINGIELFQVLFAFVVFADWPRLNKSHALLAYFAGIAAMLLGNLLRLTSFVVLGNRGFADFLSRFHISAGWIFFSFLFLVFLSVSYRWLLISSKRARVQN